MEEYYYVPIKENPNTFVLSHNGSYKTYNEDFSLVNGHQTFKFTVEIMGITYGFVHPMVFHKETMIFGKPYRIPKNELLYYPVMKDGNIRKSNTFYSQSDNVDALCKLLECIGFKVIATSKSRPTILGRKLYRPIYGYGYNSSVFVVLDIMEEIKKVGFKNLDEDIKELLYCEPLDIKPYSKNRYEEAKNDGVTFRLNNDLCTKIYRSDIEAYVCYKSKDVLMNCVENGIVKYNYILSISNEIKKELSECRKNSFKKPFIELESALNKWLYNKNGGLQEKVVQTCIIKVISEALRCGLTI